MVKLGDRDNTGTDLSARFMVSFRSQRVQVVLIRQKERNGGGGVFLCQNLVEVRS